MKFPFIPIFLFLISTPVFAQQAHPGGVPGYAHWSLLQGQDTPDYHWKNLAENHSQQLPDDGFALGWLNGWPAPRLPFAEIPRVLSLPPKAADQVTIFAVYQPTDAEEEQAVWSWQTNQSAELVLTNHRLADVATPAYLNFGEVKGHAQMSAYVHHQKKSYLPGERQLLLGQRPTNPALPISDWHGLLPEVIVFNRLLLPKERRRVESYLALKYGLTLRNGQEGVDYLAADGQVIWHYEQHQDFHHRIIGIGRDDAAGWWQGQSSSVLAEDLLQITIGVGGENNWQNLPQIPDQSFLILGDDNGELSWSDEAFHLGAVRLQRNWLAERQGFGESIGGDLRLETGRWPIVEDEIYWLAVDRSGSGNFDLAHTDYYPIAHQSQGRFAHFQDILWDLDRSGTDIFTILRGPALLLQAEIQPAHCAEDKPGSLRLHAAGGTAPYRYLLTNTDNNEQRQGALSSLDVIELTGLPAGSYQLSISDVVGSQVTRDFFLSPEDAPQVALASEYTLPLDGVLPLAPTLLSSSTQVDWHWQGPDGFGSQEPQVSLTQAGVYQLSVSENGCVNQYHFEVIKRTVENPLQVTVYPNPVARDKAFQWQAILPAKGKLSVSLSNSQGQILREQTLRGDQYYAREERPLEAGIYWLNFRFDQHQQTLKIIVQ